MHRADRLSYSRTVRIVHTSPPPTAMAPPKSAKSSKAKKSSKRSESRADALLALSNPAVMRMAKRGNVRSLRADAYGPFRDIMAYYMERAIGSTLAVMHADGDKRTVLARHVIRGFRGRGLEICA